MSPAPDDTARAPGLHEAARRAAGLHRSYQEALAAADTPDHKLAIMANYGDIALSILPQIADALEAALQGAAGDEERARGFAQAYLAGGYGEEAVREIQAILRGHLAAVRAEAAAAERARLTRPEPERMERLARLMHPGRWQYHDTMRAWDAEAAEKGQGPAGYYSEAADKTAADSLREARTFLAALAAEPPCPACGATDERGCRGLEVGP